MPSFQGEFWYISDDLFAEDGIIRSNREGDMFVPQQGWKYIRRCTTIGSGDELCFKESEASKPCIFPFKFNEVTAFGCIVYFEDEKV